jgi:hypothetical protein
MTPRRARMRWENALLGDSEERLGGCREKHVEGPWKKRMLANRGFPTEAATTALHSDLRVMTRTALFLLEIPCRGSVAHVALRCTSLGRSKMRRCISYPSLQIPWFRGATEMFLDFTKDRLRFVGRLKTYCADLLGICSSRQWGSSCRDGSSLCEHTLARRSKVDLALQHNTCLDDKILLNCLRR